MISAGAGIATMVMWVCSQAMTRLWAIAIVGVIIGGGARAARAQADAEHEAYERARPVFETYCTKCHATLPARTTSRSSTST